MRANFGALCITGPFLDLSWTIFQSCLPKAGVVGHGNALLYRAFWMQITKSLVFWHKPAIWGYDNDNPNFYCNQVSLHKPEHIICRIH